MPSNARIRKNLMWLIRCVRCICKVTNKVTASTDKRQKKEDTEKTSNYTYEILVRWHAYIANSAATNGKIIHSPARYHPTRPMTLCVQKFNKIFHYRRLWHCQRRRLVMLYIRRHTHTVPRAITSRSLC